MSKIEERMVESVLEGKDMSRDGTKVRIVCQEETGEYHSAFVSYRGTEVAHYYWSLTDVRWTIRLTDGLKRTPVVLSRLNALIQGVAKGGKRNSIYDVLEPSKFWVYKMGASRYKWSGTHYFFANPPK